MSKIPYMPFFVEPFQADTKHLSYTELGLYTAVLMDLWLAPRQRFPNDPQWLGRKFRLAPAEVDSMLMPLVREFCRVDGNWVWHERLSREFARVAAQASNFAETQRIRANARWHKETLANPSDYPKPLKDKGSQDANARAGIKSDSDKPLKTNGQNHAKSTLRKKETPIPTLESLSSDSESYRKAPPHNNGKVYRWSGDCIRLTEKHYRAWQSAYHAIDLDAHLQQLDDYLASEADDKHRGNWFMMVSGCLRKRHQEAIERAERPSYFQGYASNPIVQ